MNVNFGEFGNRRAYRAAAFVPAESLRRAGEGKENDERREESSEIQMKLPNVFEHGDLESVKQPCPASAGFSRCRRSARWF